MTRAGLPLLGDRMRVSTAVLIVLFAGLLTLYAFFHPPANAAQVPAPQPSPSAAADLARYIGHDPFDAIGGVRFLDQPVVTKAVTALVPDPMIRSLVLGGDGPGTPIVLQAGKLVAWGCETHNCGDHDWSILIASDGGGAQVCYHDAATMQGRARWYVAPGRSEMRDGDCPSGA